MCDAIQRGIVCSHCWLLDAQQTLAPEAEGGQTLELVKPEFANPSCEIKKERHYYQGKSGGI